MTQLKYRYRTNWRGQLILQVGGVARSTCPITCDDGPEYMYWRDAVAEDLTEFALPIPAPAKDVK